MFATAPARASAGSKRAGAPTAPVPPQRQKKRHDTLAVAAAGAAAPARARVGSKRAGAPTAPAPPLRQKMRKVAGRGLHLFTLQLNLSTFCVPGGAVRGCFRVVQGMVGGIRGVLDVLLCEKQLKLS